MTNFRDIVINEEEGTVEVGAGLIWTDVYSYLVPKGLNVVGGRIDGVGVAGFTLGGGRHSSSLHTSRFSTLIYSTARIFLEDQSVWSYNRHTHRIRTRAAERTCEEGHRGGRRSMVRTQGMSKYCL